MNLEYLEFLKLASPFSDIDPKNLQTLASELKEQRVASGTMILRQGEPGDACYLIRKGRVEVFETTKSGEEKTLAELGPGSLFGETALLTDAPRNASIRALEACELLALSRADLTAALSSDQKFGAHLLEILQLRDRPRQCPGIVVQDRQTHEGLPLKILKDPHHGTYYQLSPEGWFIWQHLDGAHNLRDLTLSYFDQFKTFAPYAIAETIGRLTHAGFVQSRVPVAHPENFHPDASWGQHLMRFVRAVLEWRLLLQNIDRPLTRLHRLVGHWFYQKSVQIVLGVATIFGGVVFLAQGSSVQMALTQVREPKVWLLLIPMALVAILAHEMGHALTTKEFGREVRAVGLGWYWFGPIFFVDTSDMWLEKKWPRIAVSLAGVYANLVLASVVSLVAWELPPGAWSAAGWIFALGSYLMVLVNLNPLMEYDGYYVLMDLLNRPNLRRHCLSWIGQELPAAMCNPAALKKHQVELLFGLGSLLYVILMTIQTVVMYRFFIEDWVRPYLSSLLAASLSWLVAAATLLLCTVGVVGELRDID